MKNLNEIVYGILSGNETIAGYVGENILDAYPNEVENFPCIIFLDANQSDTEFADNKPQADVAEVEIHIFTKALDGFPTATEIGEAVYVAMNENYFVLTGGRGLSDPDDEVRHRIMNFRNIIF